MEMQEQYLATIRVLGCVSPPRGKRQSIRWITQPSNIFLLIDLDDDVDGRVCDVRREPGSLRVYLPGLDAVRRVRRVAVGVAARLNALGDPLPPSVERLGRAEVLWWQNNGLRF